MKNFPDPLKQDFNSKLPAIRILSDRGIKQAIKHNVLVVEPEIDLEHPQGRIQPATIDLRFEEVTSWFTPAGGYDDGAFTNDDNTLRAGKVSWVAFIEGMKSLTTPQGIHYFHPFLDGRSSLLRLGAALPNQTPFNGEIRPSNIEATIFNTSPNDIIFNKGERIVQSFIGVYPFADTYLIPFNEGSEPPLTKQGDLIRGLEMGIQVKTDEEITNLSRKGLHKIERKNGKKPEIWEGLVLLHAVKANRIRKLNEGIKFSERSKYKPGELIEPVDISRRYSIKEGEHLIVEVEENFDLSPHIGISVLNNLIGGEIPGAPSLRAFSPHRTKSGEEALRQSVFNMSLNCIRNSWIDPGYKGMMTGFPKILGRSIIEGDVVGYAQVFYFPKGVENPYGSKNLGSQYQRQKDFRLSRKV